jgi:hypothetical protein
MGAENFASTGMRSPVLPAHNESLYRLSYPGVSFKGIKFISFGMEIYFDGF